MNKNNYKVFLDKKVDEYNQPSFIINDPVSVPHLFTRKQDVEIAGFFAAIFAWGNRTTIIKKGKELMSLMAMEPYEFCLHHTDNDLKKLLQFRHRTFTATDLLYFIEFLKYHYGRYNSLESAFTIHGDTIEKMLTGFHHYFFSLDEYPPRTRKHVSNPEKGSTCKRLNMFLRWMVRKDDKGVDFGIWENISPSNLICPVDLHVARVARKMKLLHRKQTDWLAAVELTEHLKKFDSNDPVKYDFALFSLGIDERF